MSQDQVTPMSGILCLQACVMALFQNSRDKDLLLRRFDNARDDLKTTALFSQLSEADLKTYEALCEGMRRLLSIAQG